MKKAVAKTKVKKGQRLSQAEKPGNYWRVEYGVSPKVRKGRRSSRAKCNCAYCRWRPAKAKRLSQAARLTQARLADAERIDRIRKRLGFDSGAVDAKFEEDLAGPLLKYILEHAKDGAAFVERCVGRIAMLEEEVKKLQFSLECVKIGIDACVRKGR